MKRAADEVSAILVPGADDRHILIGQPYRPVLDRRPGHRGGEGEKVVRRDLLPQRLEGVTHHPATAEGIEDRVAVEPRNEINQRGNDLVLAPHEPESRKLGRSLDRRHHAGCAGTPLEEDRHSRRDAECPRGERRVVARPAGARTPSHQPGGP